MRIEMKTTVLMAGIAAALVLTSVEVNAKPGGQRVDFETLDVNGDGQISMEEIEAQGAARFAAADTNGDGVLSAEEMTAAADERAASRVTRMIERLDTDEDGAISQEEMAAAQERRGGDRAERMFERADADGNGTISEEEFEAAKERRGDRSGRGGKKGPRNDNSNDG